MCPDEGAPQATLPGAPKVLWFVPGPIADRLIAVSNWTVKLELWGRYLLKWRDAAEAPERTETGTLCWDDLTTTVSDVRKWDQQENQPPDEPRDEADELGHTWMKFVLFDKLLFSPLRDSEVNFRKVPLGIQKLSRCWEINAKWKLSRESPALFDEGRLLWLEAREQVCALRWFCHFSFKCVSCHSGKVALS